LESRCSSIQEQIQIEGKPILDYQKLHDEIEEPTAYLSKVVRRYCTYAKANLRKKDMFTTILTKDKIDALEQEK